MIYIGTILRTSDNSGASICQCIKILGNRTQPGYANLADRIVVSVKRARVDKKIKKHDVLRGVVIRMRKRTTRTNGLVFSSDQNRIIIIDKKNNPACTRIFGVVTHEPRFRRFIKIISMASSVS